MPDEPVLPAPAAKAAMSLEAQLRQRIDVLIDQLSADLTTQLRALADELVTSTAADRSGAVEQAVRATEEETARRVSDVAADARLALEEAQEELRVAAAATASERAARVGEREDMLVGFEHLLGHLRALDDAASLREALDRLGKSLEAAGARSLLLVRRGDVFRGWRFTGFGPETPEPWSVSVAPDEAGPLSRVIQDGEAAEIHPDDFGQGGLRDLAFAAQPHDRAGLAVPVSIGGVTIAVGYVDDGGADDRVVPGPWPEVVEILARHTSRRIEALTARRAAAFGLVPRGQGVAAPPSALTEHSGTSEPRAIEAAERYARLLVAEIRLYHEPAIRLGRQHGDLRRRLHGEIERARRMYEERVPASLPGRAEYFERELIRTLAEGDPDALGTD